MRVVISGNGIASKVLQLLLSKHKFLTSVTVFEKSPLPSAERFESTPEYIGLWGPSIHILDWLGLWNRISNEEYVTKSSYRTANGKHIAKPYSDLIQPGKGKNSLVFVERRELLELLNNALSQTDAASATITHSLYDESIMKIERSTNGVEIKTSKNQKLTTDLLVAADGQFSNVRNLIYPDQSFLSYRGYTVYRGHTNLGSKSNSSSNSNNNTYANNGSEQQQVSTNKDGIVPDGFQSWGVGSRFACVPTRVGNAWFAAVTTPPLLSSLRLSSLPRHEQNQQILFDKSHSSSNSSGSSSSSSNQNNEPKYLFQGNRTITKSEYDMLKSTFSLWHTPISDLLSNTKIQDISVCNAFAFETIIPKGLSGQPFYNNADFVNNTGASASSSLSSSTRRSANSSTGINTLAADVGIVFIGDAAHTLDPILAQGAGVAIEDAALLNYAIFQHMKPQLQAQPQTKPQSHINSNINSDSSSNANISGTRSSNSNIDKNNNSNLCMTSFQKALHSYEVDRSRRISTLHHLSNLTQFVGHINSPTAVIIRNAMISLMNQSKVFRYISEKVFDFAINLSTNSRVFDYYKKI